MLSRRTAIVGLAGLVCVACLGGKARDDKGESGTVVGKLVEKGENWIRVLEDGKEESVRYTPRWTGGLPKDGGGLDKEMLAMIGKLKSGSRVTLEWEFEERPRVLKIEVLEEPKSGS